MKKTIILSSLILFIFSCVNKEYQTLEKKLHTIVSIKIDTLTIALTEIEKEDDKKKLILQFKKTRKEYKKI